MMNERVWLVGAWLVAASILGMTDSATAEEIYTATLIASDGMGADRKADLKLTIKQRTTDEESAELQKILEEEGSDALFAKLRTWDKGLAEIRGSASQKILHVRVFPGENGSRVIIVTEGQLYMPDRSQDPRLANALGFIQLDVGTRGRGEGIAAPIEGVSVTDEGVLQLVTEGRARIRLENVAREN